MIDLAGLLRCWSLRHRSYSYFGLDHYSTVWLGETLPLPCASTACVAKTLVLPCVFIGFVAKTLPFLADFQTMPGPRTRPTMLPVNPETEHWPFHCLSLTFSLPFRDLSLSFLDLPLPFRVLPLPFLELSLPLVIVGAVDSEGLIQRWCIGVSAFRRRAQERQTFPRLP